MGDYSTLFLIPARGGSKGIPHKNIRLLNGKPLIYYSIDLAKQLTSIDNICVSSDDDTIIKAVTDYGIRVPFVRPVELATDEATTNDVITHALNYYIGKGIAYERIVLLQPTSPLRTADQVKSAIDLYSDDTDMVVGVKEVRITSTLRTENKEGFLEKVFKEEKGIRRQDVARLYEINGAVYVINAQSIMSTSMQEFKRVKKYIMPEKESLDIDSIDDWNYCEYLLRNGG